MKVILKKDVQSLGEAGDILEVKDGYARNFLLPQNMAEAATKGALENREKNIARIKAKAEKLHQEALDSAESIKNIGVIELEAKAGESGKLFGAITTRKLAEVILEKSGIEVDKRNVSLNKPINMVGEYELLIKLTSKVDLTIDVVVKASEVIKEEIISEVEAQEEAAEEVVEETATEEVVEVQEEKTEESAE